MEWHAKLPSNILLIYTMGVVENVVNCSCTLKYDEFERDLPS